MTELDKKIKDLKDFIKHKTDQGTANYLGKEIREICGMVETEQLTIHSVVSSEITVSDLNQEFIIIRDDLVEIEKGSVVILLDINYNGRHEFMDINNDVYYFEADCVERKK